MRNGILYLEYPPPSSSLQPLLSYICYSYTYVHTQRGCSHTYAHRQSFGSDPVNVHQPDWLKQNNYS